jgi:hypothetical protein
MLSPSAKHRTGPVKDLAVFRIRRGIGLTRKVDSTQFSCAVLRESQAFGNKAKQFTSKLVFGEDSTIIEHGLDKYGRFTDQEEALPRILDTFS